MTIAALQAPREGGMGPALNAAALAAAAQGSLDSFIKALHAADPADREAVALRLVAERTAHLRLIADTSARAEAAQAMLDAIDARANAERYDRDIALLVMLRPWNAAERAFKREKAALDADLDAGRMHRDGYDGLLQYATERKRAAGRAAPWKPTPACKLAHISRGLWASRIKPREPENPPTMPLPVAEETAARAGWLVKNLEALRVDIQKVRNVAVDDLLNDDGVPNAKVSRVLGKTTARIAQLRTGTR